MDEILIVSGSKWYNACQPRSQTNQTARCPSCVPRPIAATAVHHRQNTARPAVGMHAALFPMIPSRCIISPSRMPGLTKNEPLPSRPRRISRKYRLKEAR